MYSIITTWTFQSLFHKPAVVWWIVMDLFGVSLLSLLLLLLLALCFDWLIDWFVWFDLCLSVCSYLDWINFKWCTMGMTVCMCIVQMWWFWMIFMVCSFWMWMEWVHIIHIDEDGWNNRCTIFLQQMKDLFSWVVREMFKLMNIFLECNVQLDWYGMGSHSLYSYSLIFGQDLSYNKYTKSIDSQMDS